MPLQRKTISFLQKKRGGNALTTPKCYAKFKCDYQQWRIRNNPRRQIPLCKFEGTCNQQKKYDYNHKLTVEKPRGPKHGGQQFLKWNEVEVE